MIRAFIAVELTSSARREIHRLQTKLQEADADVKWVNPNQLHLTLKFLGNIEETQIHSLEEALAETLHKFSPFSLQIEGLGAFPKTTAPRVLWVGVSTGEQELVALAGAAEKACQALRFEPEERPFRGHLTIGRIRSGKQLASLVQLLEGIKFKGSVLSPIEKVILFQSTLSPSEPTYKRLAEIPLVSSK